jgi:hypothetical protein
MDVIVHEDPRVDRAPGRHDIAPHPVKEMDPFLVVSEDGALVDGLAP